MKVKNILNCLFASLLVLIVITFSFLTIGLHAPDQINHLITVIVEPLTYCCYAFAFGVMISHLELYKTKLEKLHCSLFIMLFICALLREMGIQHWLATKDTTAFKLRFFSNPNNPISEKIVAGLILVVVISVVIYLLIYYIPKTIKGFFKMNPLSWSIVTLGGVGIVGKTIDRLPANLRGAGYNLEPIWIAWLKLFEETSEFCLPLICAVAVFQFAFARKQKIRAQ